MATATAEITVKINHAKFYVPIVTLSINGNIKFLENIKQGLKRTTSWKKHESEITTQPKNNNLDYLIDPNLEKLIDCLYFHSKMLIMILREIVLMSITCY